MNSDYSHNPLTEVALALSMAFFALMVLTIFALSQKQFKSIESLQLIKTKKIKKEYWFFTIIKISMTKILKFGD